MNRKSHFNTVIGSDASDANVADTNSKEQESAAGTGIWELPDHLLDAVSGGYNFSQAYEPGQQTGPDFAQNFACFAQNIGDFSQCYPPLCC
jgi:hypothetical protein